MKTAQKASPVLGARCSCLGTITSPRQRGRRPTRPAKTWWRGCGRAMHRLARAGVNGTAGKVQWPRPRKSVYARLSATVTSFSKCAWQLFLRGGDPSLWRCQRRPPLLLLAADELHCLQVDEVLAIGLAPQGVKHRTKRPCPPPIRQLGTSALEGWRERFPVGIGSVPQQLNGRSRGACSDKYSAACFPVKPAAQDCSQMFSQA